MTPTGRASDALDRFAALVRSVLTTSAAVVSLADVDGQTMLGASGLGEPGATLRATSLSHSLCQHVVGTGQMLTVSDTRSEPDLLPDAATRDLGVIAYAGVPLTDAAGAVLGALCVIEHQPRDWSERDASLLADLGDACSAQLRLHLAEAALADTEQRFRLTFEHAPIGMALTGRRPQNAGRFLLVNEALCELTGYSDAELLLRTLPRIAHPEDRATLAAVLSEMVAGAVTHWSGDHRLVHADGHELWVHISTSVAHDAAGAPSYGVLQLVDISARKHAELQVETRFRQLADNVSIGFALRALDPPEMLYANAAYLRIFGFDPTQPIPSLTRIRALVHPDDAQRSTDLFDRVQQGHSVQQDLRVVLPDGQQKWVQFTLHPVLEPDGSVQQLTGLFEDITDRVHTDAALRASERRFTQLADSLTVGINLRRLQPPKFLYANPAYIRLVGADPAHPDDTDRRSSTDTGTDPALSLLHPEDYERVMSDYWPLAQAGGFAQSEHRVLRPDGGVRWVRVTSTPVLDDDGAFTQVAGTIEDITDRKSAEAAVHSARAEAEKANVAKSEFLSRMSHELRTPLNAVLGFGQLLELDAPSLTARNQKAVGHILTGARHLLAMIDDVLDISRIEADELELSSEPVDAPELLREALALMHPAATAAGITLRYDEQPHPDPSSTDIVGEYVQADRRRLLQVMLNLLSNAIKYNTVRGRVTVATSIRDDTMLLSVTDSGIGIRAEHLSRLFTAFDRLGQQTGAIEGTGIGLALTQRLVLIMGGTLDVASTPGQGSTFTVALPIVASPLTPVPEASDLVAVSAAALPGTVIATMLYIEDNQPNIVLMQRLIELRPDWTLISACTGAAGLTLAAMLAPSLNLIMLDLHLPDADGIDILRALQADSRTAGIPVIVLSADANPHEIHRLKKAGAHTYRTKPLDITEILHDLDEHTPRAPAPRLHAEVIGTVAPRPPSR